MQRREGLSPYFALDQNHGEFLSPLNSLLLKVSEIPLLTDAELKDLCVQRDVTKLSLDEENYRSIIDTICMFNLRLVVKVAWRFRKEEVSLIDSIHNGYFGLRDAAKNFNPERGTKFSTLAGLYIRQQIVEAEREQAHLIVPTTYEYVNLQKIRKITRDRRKRYGKEPSKQFISKKTGISKEEIERLRLYNLRPKSLDEIQKNTGQNKYSALADPHSQDDEEMILDSLSRIQFKQRLKEHLNGEEYFIFVSRFGLNGDEAKYNYEIGKDIGRSKEYVRLVVKKILAQIIEFDWFKEYLDLDQFYG